MVIVPRSASIVAPLPIRLPPADEIVIWPGGPGALAFNNENNCAPPPRVMALPLVRPLVSESIPPAALRRRGVGVRPGFGSFEETRMLEFTFTAPPVDVSETMPPVPPNPTFAELMPVVAWIGAFAVIAPVDVIVN